MRTMPRTPLWPYMIEMVSTKTFSAREPDHSETSRPDRDDVGAPVAEHVVDGGDDHVPDAGVR